jgi:hypothetical protein
MIDSTIKLFGVLTMKNPELVSVFVHEFAHYIDIYFLEKNSYSYVDTSNYFYSIAWQSTKIVKS